MLRRARRSFAFARRVPPRQLARRMGLMLRRRIERVFPPRREDRQLRRAVAPPRPLFAPREGLAARTENGWRFCFLGRALSMRSVVDWQAHDPGGSIQLWRMNLHYMEYLEALPDEQVEDLVAQWIAANPPYRVGANDAAWNAYALSVRATVWMQQFASRPALDETLLREAERSLVGQLLHLERHLETDIGGNHLIKNLKALLWASVYFEGPAARRWRRLALRLLARELPRQILPDGMHFELSPSYHCQVFADLLEIRHALGGDPLGGNLDEALARAAQAIADLAHPDGRVAQFGDAGLHMAYAPGPCLAAYAATGGSPPRPAPAFFMGQAGYFGVRDADSYVVADAGPIAAPALPAHGHGDMFSFEWSLDGQRIVVDQGVYDYVAGERRRLSRSARSHNTLHIEGGDQGDFFGAFRLGRMARPTVERHALDGRNIRVDAHHDGYRPLPGAPVHHRSFALSPRRISIRDRIEGRLFGEARIALLLHPEVAVERADDLTLRLTSGGASATVNGSHAIHVEEAFWWPDMGVEAKTVRLVMILAAGANEASLELAGLEPDQDRGS